MTNDRTTSWSPDGLERERGSVTARMPEVGDLLGGRFLLRKVLGTGGSGVVFAATDVQLDEKVAVKVLYPHLVDAQGLERLRREVRAARGGSPHTAAVHDLHAAGDVHFLSMELVEGESLRERLRSGGALPVDEVIRVGRQIASALAHLHGRGVVHRDVKPGNILVTSDGTAKLCDMGLARPLERGLTVTETAMVVGTPAYMAPEQATGGDLVPASDVYALGLTLYQALTGKVPLTDDTALSTLMRRQKERPSGVRSQRPECPRWLGRLLGRMLLPGPAERPSAAAVERALERRQYALRPRRRTVAVAALVAVVLVAIPLGYSVIQQRATVRVEVAGNEVHGVDTRGRVTWRHPLHGLVAQSVKADLDGDSVPEQIVATVAARGNRRSSADRQRDRIVALRRNGTVVTDVALDDLVLRWGYAYPPKFWPYVKAMDLDEDGRDEIVALCAQRNFFPGMLLVYWPRWDRWDEVLTHSGNFLDVTYHADKKRPRLIFSAVNNRLAMTRVVGEVEVLAPGVRPNNGETIPLVSPEITYAPSTVASWVFYVPIGEWSSEGPVGPDAIRAQSNGDIDVESGPSRDVLDRWGNPKSGPNAGRDLMALRSLFWQRLAGLRPENQPPRPAEVRRMAVELRREVSPLLAEPAYDVILGIKTARALARAGDLSDAVAVLRRTVQREPYEDAVYRLAHLEALAGQLQTASHELLTIIRRPRTPRGRFDAPHLLLRLGIAQRDRNSVHTAIDRLMARADTEEKLGLANALWARAHLWWDSPTEADCHAVSWAYEPAGAALACLARWRLGRTAADDPATMSRDADVNPDAGYEFRIARAAAQLGLGRAADALATLEPLIDVLESISKDDFSNHQLFDLARALHCKALAAAGRRQDAAAEAEELLPTLKPGLLPFKLATEALAAVRGRPRASVVR